MKTSYAATIALALATLAAGQAMAADNATSKTREQVRAELFEAQRTGDMVAGKNMGDEITSGAGTKLNELYPASYPAKAVAAGKTREQVRAEMIEAQRTGDIVASSNDRDEFTPGVGVKLNELFPNRYPAKAAAPVKTREQVRAELKEAQRTGDIVVLHGSRDEFTVASGNKLNELYPSRYPAKAVN